MPHRRLIAASFLTVLALLPAACGGGPDSTRAVALDLARDFRPHLVVRDGERWGDPTAVGGTLWRADSPETVITRRPIAPQAWERLGPGLWRAPRLVPGAERGVGEDALRELRLGGRPIAPLESKRFGFTLRHTQPGAASAELIEALHRAADGPRYHLIGGYVFYFDPAGGAPGAGELVETVSLGCAENGSWVVTLWKLRARGVPLLSGRREALTIDFAPRSRLVFTLAGLASPRPDGKRHRVRFFARLDGAPLFDVRLEVGAEPRPYACSVALPKEGGTGARLELGLEGPPCLGAFLVPRVAPAEPPERGRRERADLVLFLADTFRADNLACYGGDPRVTPALNRLAAESLVFAEVRAPSSWTMPSHASMFSGLFPHQSGASSRDRTLPPQAHTIAEVLAEAGYRTVGLSEGGYVSPAFGLAQGFEWFETGPRDIERTIERAVERIDADDGRPLFLFVQTYRAHKEYVTSARTLARIGIDLDEEELAARLALPTRDERRIAAQLALYRGASSDLDAGFGELRAAAQARGLWERAFWVFTSDHGEAFFEHGVSEHGNGVWEEHLRVPLLLRGPGIAPGRIPWAASLVDLPRTLAHLAGVEPLSEWMGTNLFTLDRQRASYAFQCTQAGPPDRAALIEGTRKVLFPNENPGDELPAVELAYDLGQDPGETQDQAQEPWARELLRRHAKELRALFRPRLTSGRAHLDPELVEGLKALGYLGD